MSGLAALLARYAVRCVAISCQVVWFFASAALAATPPLLTRPRGIGPDELAVVVNADDPASVAIGKYYQERRRLPKSNLVKVHFPPGSPVMGRDQFEGVRAELIPQLPAGVQALVLTWMKPWRVDCMSITTAFAAGFDPAYCAVGCKPTKVSSYFNSDADRPYHAHGIRPTMSLAAADLDAAKRLIDRGVQSDGRRPAGKAYLVETSDRARSIRSGVFGEVKEKLGRLVPVEWVIGEYIANKQDVLFYFTGLAEVQKIGTNHFVPGAIADHLTSGGGVLEGGSQMSILRWLEAGATGSYGAVVEPCNYPGKFPHPGMVMARYLSGETLIEAYWKSVQMPGQGIFIGEPLARPFAGGGPVVKKRIESDARR